MRKSTIYIIAAIVGGIFLLPKILARLMPSPKQPEKAALPPTPPAPAPAPKKKKTILGKVLGGITTIAQSIPHPAAQAVANTGGVIGNVTR